MGVGLAVALSLAVVNPSPGSASTGAYDTAVAAAHPVAYWSLAGSVADGSGNGHAGSFVGGTPASATLPNGDVASDFNGSTQYATIPSSSAFSIPTTGQLTWEGWIRPDTLQFAKSASSGYIDWMGKCASYSPTCEWEARMYNQTNAQGRTSRLSAYVFNPSAGLGSAADWQPNGEIFTAGKWIYVVGEYQTKSTPGGCSSSYPGTIDIWVDGVRWSFASHSPTGCMSQYSTVPKANSSVLNIGTMAKDTWFAGAVGKVAIYNRLLTPAEISAHFNAMTGQTPSGTCANTCTLAVQPTASSSPTASPTSTASLTPTPTASPTSSASLTPTPTASPTSTASPTPTRTASPSPTPSPTPTRSRCRWHYCARLSLRPATLTP